MGETEIQYRSRDYALVRVLVCREGGPELRELELPELDSWGMGALQQPVSK
jgi:hypothetical protein